MNKIGELIADLLLINTLALASLALASNYDEKRSLFIKIANTPAPSRPSSHNLMLPPAPSRPP